LVRRIDEYNMKIIERHKAESGSITAGECFDAGVRVDLKPIAK
jgi:hypothetical protein